MAKSVRGEKIVQRKFFERAADDLAPKLLGKKLVHVIGGKRLSGLIVEVEAYLGAQDAAAHTFDGHRSERVEAMYRGGGISYVYFIYGMHFCFNVVAGREGDGQAVLIRALEPLEGIEDMRQYRRSKKDHDLTNGPAKLCQALQINRDQYGIDLTKSKTFFLEDVGRKVARSQIVARPRIGVDYAGAAARWPLRFYIKDNKFISKP